MGTNTGGGVGEAPPHLQSMGKDQNMSLLAPFDRLCVALCLPYEIGDFLKFCIVLALRNSWGVGGGGGSRD